MTWEIQYKFCPEKNQTFHSKETAMKFFLMEKLRGLSVSILEIKDITDEVSKQEIILRPRST